MTRFAVGDEVYARPRDGRIGTFAERIAVHEDDLATKPASLSMAEAASVPLVALTAWQALVERANLQPGQKVLIHAGSGGVGTYAIQLAKHLGATVATTTGTSNVEWVRDLGADVVIDYRNAGLRDGRARLRRRPGLPGRRHAREVAARLEARRASPSASPARRTRTSPAGKGSVFRCDWSWPCSA